MPPYWAPIVVPFQRPETTVPSVELLETIKLVVEAVPETVKEDRDVPPATVKLPPMATLPELEKVWLVKVPVMVGLVMATLERLPMLETAWKILFCCKSELDWRLEIWLKNLVFMSFNFSSKYPLAMPSNKVVAKVLISFLMLSAFVAEAETINLLSLIFLTCSSNMAN